MKLPDDLKVTVCDACNRCCCWQGIFFCDDYMTAGTKEITVAEWREIMRTHPNREHADYLRSDEAAKEFLAGVARKEKD